MTKVGEINSIRKTWEIFKTVGERQPRRLSLPNSQEERDGVMNAWGGSSSGTVESSTFAPVPWISKRSRLEPPRHRPAAFIYVARQGLKGECPGLCFCRAISLGNAKEKAEMVGAAGGPRAGLA
ncbi:MAG TPA: hypothetical protein VHH73_09580, partial [Verrucomicrobiae bacterium]|nr:hypothetical protein [Verrucomicrobiae bacterium]